MCELKNTLEGINRRLNKAEIIITEREKTATDIIKSGTGYFCILKLRVIAP